MCYQNNWDVYDKSTHPGGKTIEMVSEISFDTENLIQMPGRITSLIQVMVYFSMPRITGKDL